MKPRFWTEILLFLSSYIPLWIIFLVQNIDFPTKILGFGISIGMLLLSVFALIVFVYNLKLISSPYPKVCIESVEDKSKDLLSYALPYIASLIGLEIYKPEMAVSFGIFLLFMFVLSYKSNEIYKDPLLILMGYSLVEVKCHINGAMQSRYLILKKSERENLLSSAVKMAKVNDNTFILCKE